MKFETDRIDGMVGFGIGWDMTDHSILWSLFVWHGKIIFGKKGLTR